LTYRIIINILKAIKWIIYSIVILLIVAYLLLRLTVVQTYFAKKTADYLSEKAGVEISIKRLNISEFVNVELSELEVRDHHDSLFLKANTLSVNVIPAFLLEDVLYVKNIQIDSLFLALVTYHNEDELNLTRIIDSFISSETTDTTSIDFAYKVASLDIRNSIFALDNQNEDYTEGMDYSHLYVDSINIRIKDFKVRQDSLIGSIIHLTANEKSGFELKSFQGDVLLSPRELIIPNFHFRTNHSWVYSDFKLKYKEYPDWLSFINNVRFDTKIDSSNIYVDDVKYFATSLKGMKNYITLSSEIKGSIANLKLRKTQLFYGDNSKFNGDIGISGLPEIDQSFIRLKVKKATINSSDLNRFYLSDDKKLSLNKSFNKLGNIYISGRFTGFYYDFVSNASFNTALGKFKTDISLQPNHNETELSYSGKINTYDFDLGKLLNTNYLGKINMDGQFIGSGLNLDLDAKYKIHFSKIVIGGSLYKKLTIDGELKNRLVSTNMDFRGDTSNVLLTGFYDYSDSLDHIKLNARIIKSRVNRFFMIDEDTLGSISANIEIDLIGNKLDEFQGRIALDSTIYLYKGIKYIADSIVLISEFNENNKRNVLFYSPYLDADLSGFRRISDFPVMYKLLFHNILPNLINSNSIAVINPLKWKSEKERMDEYIKFDLAFKNTKNIIKLFSPSFSISEGSIMKGHYNFSNDSLSLVMKSSKMTFGGFIADSIDISLRKDNDIMSYTVDAGYIMTPNDLEFNSFVFDGYLHRDTVGFKLIWGDTIGINKGDLRGKIVWNDTNSFEMDFSKGEFYLQDSLWLLRPETKISYSYHRFLVSDFELLNNSNSIYVDGLLTDNSHDILSMKFNSFNVSLFDFYTKKWDTDIDGFITGKVELSSLWYNPSFISDFKVNKFFLNGVDLNELEMNTIYSRSRKALVFDIIMNSKDEKYKYLDIGGFFYPFKKENQFDLELRINKYPFKSIEKYLSSLSSKVEGEGTGIIKLKGSLDKPILLGAVDVDINDILIDYTNVHYKIKDKLIFTPDYFGLINAKATDFDNNEMIVTARFNHIFFNDIKTFVDIKLNNIELLNTDIDDNELFYGKANASGEFKMKGDFDKFKYEMDLTPVGEAYIAIPISNQINAEETKFLSFVVRDSSLLSADKKEEDDEMKIEMNMKLDVKPNTTIELVMDKKVGDVISARGTGKLNIVYDENENLKMYGKYIIDRGNYLFTMQNIINKRFIIDQGSSIVWDGEMENAKIKMRAIYRTDAKLWDLVQQIDTSDIYKKKSKVFCIIDITGNLYNPKVSFDIELPDESIATQELVNSLISPQATGNSEDLNKNFVSLLILGSFQAPSGYKNNEVNSTLLTHNATEMLAEQVGNLLNQLSDEVEIGLAWNPGDDITTQEIAVALSYSMLDDRLIIDGKFGTGGGSTDENASARIVGDLNVEYKLTKDGRIRAKVFNRTNYYDPISRKAPYTQGIGISFRKDFNNIKELFRSKKKIKEKEELEKNNKN